jgi:GAF domain-containing protein
MKPSTPEPLGGGQRVPEMGLRFPDGPRMELDEMLGQLVSRAQEVLATQGRLRGLLHANQMIIGDLELPAVLRHILDAARELVGARYAALGIIDPAGGLAQFVHSGMDAAQVAAIGPLPRGKGLLGALIDDPRPIRLASIADDPRSSGFPDRHPPMGSFLGVPIRIRDEVFGNLYLSESDAGAFSSEDEELVQALAATAAVAIDNARHYQTARTRQDWLRASAQITRQLLDTGPDTPVDIGASLQMIASTARSVAGAELALVICPVEQGEQVRVEIADGPGGADLIGLTLPAERSLSGRVLVTGAPLRTTEPTDHSGFAAAAAGADLPLGPALLLPLRGWRRGRGVLAMARARRPFTDEDLDMATGFAVQATLALDLAEARSEEQRAAMHDERDRIAADLHDHVIQRLFATGLVLQSVAAADCLDTARILRAVTDLDDTISQIRSTVFALHHMVRPTDTGAEPGSRTSSPR